jgi:hypothetical protein
MQKSVKGRINVKRDDSRDIKPFMAFSTFYKKGVTHLYAAKTRRKHFFFFYPFMIT